MKRYKQPISLIENIVDNRQKENDNDSYAKLIHFITSYILAKRNLGFVLQANTSASLKDFMNYSKTTFDNAKAVNPTTFKQKSEIFIDSITKEWEFYYKKIVIVSSLMVLTSSFLFILPLLLQEAVLLPLISSKNGR